jgi:3'(2'), 5'-bisphosphate nucleotidase
MKFKETEIKEIIDIMYRAGDAIMSFYVQNAASVSTQYKSDHSPVTIADTTANDIICDFLKNRFPEIPIISEETPLDSYEIRKNWEYLWLVDPLDGTKEFLNKTDEFTINIALVKNGKSVAGFIFLPAFARFYYAIKGHGAYELSNNIKTQIYASSVSLKQVGLKVVSSRSYTDERTNTYINALDRPEIIRLGSALKFISIAKGDADYYPRMINIMEWDTAAGQIIIEEAGGSLVEAASGTPLTYNKPSMVNPYFIAIGKKLD